MNAQLLGQAFNNRSKRYFGEGIEQLSELFFSPFNMDSIWFIDLWRDLLVIKKRLVKARSRFKRDAP